jgi:predicted HTH transcriptional regulator
MITIQQIKEELDIHFKRIDMILPEIKSYLPFENNDFEDIEKTKTIDSFKYRFTKIQDKMGDRFDNLSKNRQQILRYIINKPMINIEQLSKSVGISTTAIENNIKYLKENNILKRVGNNKDGSWEIIDEK